MVEKITKIHKIFSLDHFGILSECDWAGYFVWKEKYTFIIRRIEVIINNFLWYLKVPSVHNESSIKKIECNAILIFKL